MDKYKVIDAIAEDEGAADLYLALNMQNNEVVTLKLPNQSLVDKDKTYLDFFINEMRIHSNISHPNIVKYIDRGYLKGTNIPYLVMEHLSGNDLSDCIYSENTMTLHKALEIFRQVCQALRFIHSHDVIHLDLSPHNIRITERGEVKLMDFGIAHSRFDLKVSTISQVIGKIKYMAPERFENQVSPSSDIYSLGIILYELLTRSVPFKGEDRGTTRYKVLTEIPETVSNKNKVIPEAINELVMKMIEKSPSKRYSNVSQILEKLENLRFDKETLSRKIYQDLQTAKDETYEQRYPKAVQEGATISRHHQQTLTFKQITSYFLLAVLGFVGLVMIWLLGWHLGGIFGK